MALIEPNWAALIGFCALAAVCSVAFLVLAGMFPLASRPEGTRSVSGLSLVALNVLMLIALMGLTAAYGFSELRATSLVVFGGLSVLFSPGLFEAWPAGWRDNRGGLLLLFAIQIAGICGLVAAGFRPLLLST